MSVIFHAFLPILLWSVVYNKPFIINWQGAVMVDGFMLLLGIIGASSDGLPVLVNNKYHLENLVIRIFGLTIRFTFLDRLYTRIHQPWQFGKTWMWMMFALWAVFWPAGLHCLCDIPVHNPDTSLKHLWADVLVEVLLLFAIILTHNVWYVKI